MWNERKSLLLSKICVLIFIVVLVVVLATTPILVNWLMWFSANARIAPAYLFYLTIYFGGIFAAILLIDLYRLLRNIGVGKIFYDKNITHMRVISWCCFFGAFIGFISAFYYLPWGIVAIASAFMGLIVRVVKNIMQQALLLKTENDFTI